MQERDFAVMRAAELEPWLSYLHGNRFARVLVVKGIPGTAELAGKPPFFGADGQALEAAFSSLGLGTNAWCGVVSRLPKKKALSAGELRMIIETIDPLLLVALDRDAAVLMQESFGKELMPDIPRPGIKTMVLGRTYVVVDGFETALVSESKDKGESKRRVWKELSVINVEDSFSHE